MNTKLSGIAASYAGHCSLCGQGWEQGEFIEKIPGTDPVKRGHAECVARLKNNPAPQAQVAQQQTPPPNGNGVRTNGPATTGPRASQNGTSGLLVDEAAITALWQAKDAATMIAQGAMALAVALDTIARSVDPHHTKPAPPAQAKDAA